jgi:hypothetical protein
VVVVKVTETTRLCPPHMNAKAAEARGEPAQCRVDLVVEREPVQGRQDRHPVVRQPLVARRRDAQLPRDLLPSSRPGEDVEGNSKIVGATRSGPSTPSRVAGFGSGAPGKWPARGMAVTLGRWP